MQFDYAHNLTRDGERSTPTAQYNKPALSKEIIDLREGAFAREIPVSDDETLCFLTTFLRALQPVEILELGTAVGVSGAVMLEVCGNARLTTVERNADFYAEAVENFKNLGVYGRVNALFGDAGEIISSLSGTYDFIFMDCAKAQYVKYLPVLKKLMKKGGVLAADDVLLYGYLTGEKEVPKKRKMLVEHVREYIAAATSDNELSTTIINIGNGLAVSCKL